MANPLTPEQPIIKSPEKPIANPTPEKPREPLGPTEQEMANRIEQDGNPDQVLQDITESTTVTEAGIRTKPVVEIKQTPEKPVTIPLEFDLHPTTFDEVVLAGNLAKLGKGGQQRTETGELRLSIPSKSIYEVAETIPDDVLDKTDDPSNITRELLKELSQDSPDSALAAFQENTQIRIAVLDAVLGKLGEAAERSSNTVRQEQVNKARELLRVPNTGFLSEYYLGSSSAVFPGIEQADGKILSIGKLKERNIARRTGEGMAYGANKEAVENRGVAVTNSWEAADGYATLNSTAYHHTPERVQARLDQVEQRIREFEELLKQPEKTPGDHLAVTRGLDYWNDRKMVDEELLQGLHNEGSIEHQLEPPAPIVFGFDQLDNLKPETSNQDSFRTDHEIDIRTKLSKVYVPADNSDHIRAWLTKIGATNAEIYPLEAVQLVRNVDPTWWKDRENIGAMVRDAQSGRLM